MSVSSSLMRLSTLVALTTLGISQAQPFQVPPDYWNRFGGIEGAFDLGAKKYGVRYFPLPLPFDLRVIYVYHPNYKEYGLYTRYKDTDIKIGNLEGGQKGIRTLEVNHNPWQGLQFHVKLQGSNADLEGENFVNYGEMGYAKAIPVPSVPGLNMRVYGALGYAGVHNLSSQIYSHAELFAGKGFPNLIHNDATNTHINFDLNSTLRNYYFFSDSKAYTTLEVNASINGQLNSRTDVYARHFERYDFGLGDKGNNVYGLADWKGRETYAGIKYRLNAHAGPLNLYSVQYDYGHLRYDQYSISNRAALGATVRVNVAPPVRLDVTSGYDFYWGGPYVAVAPMIRLAQSSGAVGPSLQYNWLPNNNHRWGFSMVFTDKNN